MSILPYDYSMKDLPSELKGGIYNILLSEEAGQKAKIKLIFNLLLVDKASYRLINEWLLRRWDILKSYTPLNSTPAQTSTLMNMKGLIERIEKKEKRRYLPDPKRQTNALFLFKTWRQMLCKLYDDERHFNIFPSQDELESLYNEIQLRGDTALLGIWPTINKALPEIDQKNDLKSADEIRDYINHLIQEGKFPSITEFSGKELEMILFGIDKFLPNLERLILSDIKVTFLPGLTFSHLGTLKLTNCKIELLTNSIFNYTNLKFLDLSFNKILRIPNAISRLVDLNTFYICNNSLTKVNKNLSYLTNLRSINFLGNEIEKIPKSISSLTNLQLISFSNNNIKYIPEFLFHLPSLKSISLNKNKIQSIPDCTLWIEDKQLKINLEENLITRIPDGIINYLLDNKRTSKSQLIFESNPLLFIMNDAVFPDFCYKSLVQKYKEFMSYQCSSKFSKLCQLMILSENPKEIKDAYKNLTKDDKRLISNMVISLLKEEGVLQENCSDKSNRCF